MNLVLIISNLPDNIRPEGHVEDLPDFIEIEESDFSKYEPSAASSSLAPSSSRSRLAEEVFPCDCKWPHDLKEGTKPFVLM